MCMKENGKELKTQSHQANLTGPSFLSIQMHTTEYRFYTSDKNRLYAVLNHVRWCLFWCHCRRALSMIIASELVLIETTIFYRCTHTSSCVSYFCVALKIRMDPIKRKPELVNEVNRSDWWYFQPWCIVRDESWESSKNAFEETSNECFCSRRGKLSPKSLALIFQTLNTYSAVSRGRAVAEY